MSDDNQQQGYGQPQQNSEPQYQPQYQYAPPQPQYQPPEYAPPQPQYQPPQQPGYGAGQWPPMTIGSWIVTMLLLMIPIANIILVFVWAFGSNVNPSKKSYFQAYLIFAIIGIVASILLWSTIIGAFSTLFYNFGF